MAMRKMDEAEDKGTSSTQFYSLLLKGTQPADNVQSSSTTAARKTRRLNVNNNFNSERMESNQYFNDHGFGKKSPPSPNVQILNRNEEQ